MASPVPSAAPFAALPVPEDESAVPAELVPGASGLVPDAPPAIGDAWCRPPPMPPPPRLNAAAGNRVERTTQPTAIVLVADVFMAASSIFDINRSELGAVPSPISRFCNRRLCRSWFCFGEDDPFGFGAGGGQHGDNDCNRTCDDRQRQAVIAAEMLGDAGLQRRVYRCQQITELIDESGECAARGIRRQFIEMHRYDAPRALHRELHQESADRKQHGARRKR